MTDLTDESGLPEAARAFVQGGVDLLPSALSAGEVERLVAVLVARGDATRLQRLADAPDKGLAKPARKGLHLLRTRGAKVPPPEKRAFRVERGPFVEDAPSLASMIDGRGERVVWLSRPHHEGGYAVFQAEVSEAQGLIGFTPAMVGKKEWRQRVKTVLQNPRLIVAEVPAAHARWLIEQAYRRTLKVGRALPESFADVRLDLGHLEEPEQHPVLALAPPLPREEARPRLASLHELVEVGTWVPPRESLQALDVAIGQIATSPLVVEPHARKEQLEAAIDKAADEALTAEHRALLAERLRETALVVALRGRVEEARLLVSAAELTEDESVAARDNPFVRRLYDKLVDVDRLTRLEEAPGP